ncbi:MAG: methyltransferase domain-containing protein [Bacteroidetes bacterium]|nr:methyltransferase domain-containing protein [Bacteroidota bacterium]MBL7136187.1 methyltransferase domain-containing protein [Candidatus Neomarinimicrobiota bacterium]
MTRKLNLGSGSDIKKGYINLDIFKVEGVDVVHDLSIYPYPFEDNYFEEIIAIHILEHLPDTVQTLKELWRIAKPEAKIIIRVPYWNSIDSITDPTHLKLFNEYSFDFFDPRKKHFKNRSYYNYPQYRIDKITYFIYLGRYIGYRKINSKLLKHILGSLAHIWGNVIRVLEFELRKIG